MASSFVLKNYKSKFEKSERRTVAVTGAAGRIGSYFAEHSHEYYDFVLIVHPESDVSKIEKFGRIVRAKLEELKKLEDTFNGVHTVVHLAADPSPSATWESILPNNIEGTYNVCTAAVAAGVKRLIYASSIHAVSGYPVDHQVHPDESINPGDLYGVSKCFGEAMARFIAEQHKVSAICIRIGAFQPIERAKNEESVLMMNAFVSRADLIRLINCCIRADHVHFAIVHGLSDNVFNRMDITTARELLGYTPKDDFTEENPRFKELGLNKKIKQHSEQGGQKSGLRDDL
jgi:UDP-glucose 4-epimerase